MKLVLSSDKAAFSLQLIEQNIDLSKKKILKDLTI